MNRLYGASVRLLLAAVSLAAARGQESMPAAQQNAVVQKYCGSCHSDALMFGGMSVEHFDAGHPDPSLAAMLVNAGVLRRAHDGVRLLGDGELKAKVNFVVYGASKSAITTGRPMAM